MICKTMHKKHHIKASTELLEEGSGKKRKTFIQTNWRCTLCYRTWRTRQYIREK